MTFKQIQSHIDADAWQRLYDLTSKWPTKSRSQAGICRYALDELLAEKHDPDGGVWRTDTLFPEGKLRVQVHSNSVAEDVDWNELVDVYGSSSATLKTALQFLYQSLSTSDGVLFPKIETGTEASA